ncbi:hypothetical protein ACNYS0_20905 [Streptomyces sp. BH034]|uniref:hypothetical protein n=1 Tax=Streptomyces sp. BH034 TaxID=3402626 RepID=UPI003BB5A780
MAIAVVRAENYYVPPPPMPADAWAGTPLAELVYVWTEYRLSRRVTMPDGVLDGEPALYARVDANRWLVQCVCGSADIVSPADPRWACVTCGYGWVPIVVPAAEEVTAIEAELLKQPRPNRRFWWHPDDPANPSRPTEAPVPPVEPGEAEQEVPQ